MPILIDKGLLLALCVLSVLEKSGNSVYTAVFGVAVSGTFLISFLGERKGRGVLALEAAGVLLVPEAVFVLPVFFYDLLSCRTERFSIRWGIGGMVPLLAVSGVIRRGDFTELADVFVLLLLSWWLFKRTRGMGELEYSYRKTQDKTREEAMSLLRENKELLRNQDYEVQIATLGERNRIAREIHDNVGHLLTRSLFQTEALKVVYGSNAELQGALDAVKHTLEEAMDNIRRSVHDLREEAFDPELSIRMLLKEFTFCSVGFTYHAERMPRDVGYCMVSVAKEGLSNIARHSNATEARILVVEHPALYQMVLTDNGTRREKADERGMGLNNMEERVRALGGIFTVDQKEGFRIFLSIPKKKKEESA